MDNKKQIKLIISEEIYKVLEERASKLGMKTNAYIQLVLGQEVAK